MGCAIELYGNLEVRINSVVLIAVIMGRSGHILLEAELATCHDFGGHPGSRSVALNITHSSGLIARYKRR